MTTKDIEIILALSYFDYRKFLVVPNISWGMNLYECDLLAITKSGYIHEVEIKISVSDLKRDLKKRHHHNNKRIKYLWFVGPDRLRQAFIEYAPERAGIIIITDSKKYQIVRKPVPNKSTKPVGIFEFYKLARLGTIRYWHLRTRSGYC